MSMSNEMEKQLAILKQKYLASLPEKVASVRLLWETLREEKNATRLEELHRMAHSLSGSGATFGHPQLSRSAKKLECYLKEHISTGDMFEESTTVEVNNLLSFLLEESSANGCVE